MKRGIKKIVASKFWWLLLLVILFAVNWLASVFHARFDLTKEKRYTLSKATKDLLKSLDDDVQIDVFLKGNFPSKFRKLTNSVNEFLALLKESNNSKLIYRFISPLDEIPGTNGVKYADTLISMGASAINLKAQVKTGESSSLAFPYAIIKYHGREQLVTLFTVPPLFTSTSESSEKVINSAEALLEYQFVNSLNRLTQEKKPGIIYATGNGEPTDYRVQDLEQTLIKDYRFGPYDISSRPIPSEADVLLIVKPTIAFTEEEKIKIDQFVMRGGKLLCFIDNLIAEQDSLSYKPETIAYDRNLNLTDLFFRYGLRVNTDLVMDLQCDLIPFVVGGTRENPQYEFLQWNYFPLLSPGTNQLMNKNMGYVASRFANSIDTIQVNGVKKTALLVSSTNSRAISTPALISLNENKNAAEDEKFKRKAIPVAMMLEGKFTSLYKNRASQSQRDSLAANGTTFQEQSGDNKMIVVADGDIVLNDGIPDSGPLPMGWNKYTYGEYLKQSDYGKLFIPVANREFLLNCIENLVNNAAISETRNKDIVLRLLDSQKVKEQKRTWQFINIALPILIVLLFGWIYQQVRKRKYAS